jgi:hypothetical protein
MAQRKKDKSGGQWLLSSDESSSESILSEGLSEERKIRTPPKSAARQKNAKARAGNDTKKRRRLDESPGLVQMFSPGVNSSDESESSLSFRKHIAAHGKKRKKESSLQKQKSKDSFLDDDSDHDSDNNEDEDDYSSFEDDGDNDARELTPKKGNLSKRGPSKKALSKPHRGKQKAVPMKGKARRKRQHLSSLEKDTYDDNDDDDDDDDDGSISIEQESDLSKSLATDLSGSEDDTNSNSDNDSILYESRFVADGSGKKPMHALNLQFAVHLLEEQADIATSKVCSSLSRKGFKQESKRLQVRSDKHSKQVISKVRQRLRSTKLPDAYTRAQDPLAEPMDRINREREKDLERTENVLEKLAQQRERLEEELKQETRRHDKLAAERERAQAGDDDDEDDHAHSLLSQLNGATITATAGSTRQIAVPLKSAPKGTMARLILKIAKTRQDNEH